MINQPVEYTFFGTSIGRALWQWLLLTEIYCTVSWINYTHIRCIAKRLVFSCHVLTDLKLIVAGHLILWSGITTHCRKLIIFIRPQFAIYVSCMFDLLRLAVVVDKWKSLYSFSIICWWLLCICLSVQRDVLFWNSYSYIM